MVILVKNVGVLVFGQKIAQLLQRDMAFLFTIYSKYLNYASKNNCDCFLYSSRTERLNLISTQELILFLSAMNLFFTLLTSP